MALDAGPLMRLGTRGSPSWPGFALRPDTLMQTGLIRSLIACRRGGPYVGAALEPQALAVAVMRDEVVPEGGVALLRPGLQPGHVVADELAAVLVIADEALVAVDVLVQPDGVEVV